MTAKPATGAEAPLFFLSSLYAFVRDHLAVVNGVVLASGTACATLDYVAPGLPALRLGIHALTALIVSAIVLSAAFPGFASWAGRLLRGGDRARSADVSQEGVARTPASSSHRRRVASARRRPRGPRLYTGSAGSQPRVSSLSASRRAPSPALSPGLRPGASSSTARRPASGHSQELQLPLL